jgi:hypothetical protein
LAAPGVRIHSSRARQAVPFTSRAAISHAGIDAGGVSNGLSISRRPQAGLVGYDAGGTA